MASNTSKSGTNIPSVSMTANQQSRKALASQTEKSTKYANNSICDQFISTMTSLCWDLTTNWKRFCTIFLLSQSSRKGDKTTRLASIKKTNRDRSQAVLKSLHCRLDYINTSSNLILFKTIRPSRISWSTSISQLIIAL